MKIQSIACRKWGNIFIKDDLGGSTKIVRDKYIKQIYYMSGLFPKKLIIDFLGNSPFVIYILELFAYD